MIYDICRFFFYIIFKFIYPAKYSGLENIPQDEAVILAPNHLSNWDPPLVGAFVRRHIVYMAKEELFHVPILKQIMEASDVIPVRRDVNDMNSIKTALLRLKQGRCVCIFPEGARSRDGGLLPALPGVGLLASKAKVSVIPVGITGTYGLKPFKHVSIVFGKPMKFTATKRDKESLQAFADNIMLEISTLLKNQ